MRGKSIWRTWLLCLWAVLMPGVAFSQDGSPGYALPDHPLPLPVGSTRPEAGGFFTWGDYVMFRQTNPISGQTVAVRGFIVVDDSVGGPGTAGTYVGSRSEALNVAQVGGPNSHTPGYVIGLGYQFCDGSSLSVDYLNLNTNETRAAATLVPAGLLVGSNFSESFVTAFVFNFPNTYAGPPNNLNVGNPGATYGIWNAASVMELQFEQRASQFQITYRKPIVDQENYRLSGLVGPRFFWIWERFKWRTVGEDVFGNATAEDVAIYTNIVSNRMYGLHLGCRNEWYLGDGFACQLDLGGSLFFDSVKERAKYELGSRFLGPQNKRSRRVYSFVPEVEARLSLVWFPTEAIQVYAGYNLLAFFNTVASPEPIDFNFGAVNPHFEKVFRLFDGINAGIIINF
jgi:hypothetical protein